MTSTNTLTRRYRRVSMGEVRSRLGAPEEMIEGKKLDHIDKHAHRFIAHSPFLALATSDAAGRGDCSPRGDYPGFVKVLDEHTLALPDRPGNKIADSFGNIAENDHVGLLFLIPGMREALRVNGRAYVTDEPGRARPDADRGEGADPRDHRRGRRVVPALRPGTAAVAAVGPREPGAGGGTAVGR